MKIVITHPATDSTRATISATEGAIASSDTDPPTFVSYQAPIECTSETSFCSAVGTRACIGVARVDGDSGTEWFVRPTFTVGASPLCPTRNETTAVTWGKATREGNCGAGSGAGASAAAAASAAALAAVAGAAGFGLARQEA